MKKRVYNLDKSYKDFHNMKLSFFTRHMCMEFCFGDSNEEEENIATSILRSIKKVNLTNSNHFIYS